MVSFKTDQDQLAATTLQVQNTVEQMRTQARVLLNAVDTVNRWQGETANAFRASMGINTGELQKLVARLDVMANGLNETQVGVSAQEASGRQQLTATTQGDPTLTGAPLNA